MSENAVALPLHIIIKGHCLEYFPQIPEEFTWQAKPGQTITMILQDLGIKPQLIMSVVVNGIVTKKNYQPLGGERIILLSPPTGG